MKNKIIGISMIVFCFLLVGCAKVEKLDIENSISEDSIIINDNDTVSDTDTAAKDETLESDIPVVVNNDETLQKILKKSIEEYKQPPLMDVSDLPVIYDLEMDVRNVFGDLISQNNELSYAYNLTTEIDEQGLLKCKISYMPYRTGDFPENFAGIEVDSLNELIKVAQEHMWEDSVEIRITNPSLEPSNLYHALQQVGDGYIFCSFNADYTEIIFKPELDMSGKEEAYENLKRYDHLVEQITNDCIDENMTQMEKAQALYQYIVETVEYDFRVYNDINNFPRKSRTGLGALEDHMAVCTGYAVSIRSLFLKAGIPCYTVPGKAGWEWGEDHMWNVAFLDGKWLLFDATFDGLKDPGDSNSWFAYDIEASKEHFPDGNTVELLMQEVSNIK